MNAIAATRPSPSAMRSRGIGTLVCAAFAAFWASSSRTQWPPPLTATALVTIALVSGALMVAGIALIVRSRRLPRAIDAFPDDRRRTGLQFAAIFAAEVIAMNISAWLLTRHQLEAYLIPVIAIIVGLHFFPLARLFRVPRYHLTAALMTVAGAGGVAAIASGLPVDPVTALVNVACAVILWGTGFASYVATMRPLRSMSESARRG